MGTRMLGHGMPALLAWSAEAGAEAESAGTSILLQLLLLALLVFSNGFFVAAEFALVKVRLS
ncbi:MAG: hypothetical protein ACK5F7_07205, partial [Planctomycetaceae bacterium]